MFMVIQHAGSEQIARTGPSPWLAIYLSIASACIAGVALWFSRLRPARVKLMSRPAAYFVDFEDGLFRLRFPLVVHNTGSRPAVLAALRFRVPTPWRGEAFAYAHSSYDDLDGRDGRFFQPVPIEPGGSVVVVCEFLVWKVASENVRSGEYDIQLEATAANRRWRKGDAFVWRRLAGFTLSVTDHERSGFDRACIHFNGLREPG